MCWCEEGCGERNGGGVGKCVRVLGPVARRFATRKIRHKEDLPHNKYVTENLIITVGQTFATVQMWKIRHTTVIDWGGGLGRESWGGWG